MRALIVLGLILALTGCISYQSDSAYTKHQINSVRPGVTTSTWLRDHVGKPKRVVERSDGSELWRYELDEKESTNVSLFLIFNVSSKKRSESTYYFEIVDGIVEDYWRE